MFKYSFYSLLFLILFFPGLSLAWNSMCYSPTQMAALLSPPGSSKSSPKKLRGEIRGLEKSLGKWQNRLDDQVGRLADSLDEGRLGFSPQDVASEIQSYMENQQDGWDCSAESALLFRPDSFLKIFSEMLLPQAYGEISSTVNLTDVAGGCGDNLVRIGTTEGGAALCGTPAERNCKTNEPILLSNGEIKHWMWSSDKHECMELTRPPYQHECRDLGGDWQSNRKPPCMKRAVVEESSYSNFRDHPLAHSLSQNCNDEQIPRGLKKWKWDETERDVFKACKVEEIICDSGFQLNVATQKCERRVVLNYPAISTQTGCVGNGGTWNPDKKNCEFSSSASTTDPTEPYSTSVPVPAPRPKTQSVSDGDTNSEESPSKIGLNDSDDDPASIDGLTFPIDDSDTNLIPLPKPGIDGSDDEPASIDGLTFPPPPENLGPRDGRCPSEKPYYRGRRCVSKREACGEDPEKRWDPGEGCVSKSPPEADRNNPQSGPTEAECNNRSLVRIEGGTREWEWDPQETDPNEACKPKVICNKGFTPNRFNTKCVELGEDNEEVTAQESNEDSTANGGATGEDNEEVTAQESNEASTASGSVEVNRPAYEGRVSTVTPEEVEEMLTETPCPEWKKHGAFGTRGRVKDSFCDTYAQDKKNCKEALARIKKYLSQMAKLEKRKDKLEDEAFSAEMERIKGPSETEASGLCFDCLKKVIASSRPTAGQNMGNVLRMLTGVGIGMVGYNLGQSAQLDANMLRVRQGHEAQNDYYSLMGASAGFPYLSQGLYGLTRTNTPTGGWACSPTMSPFGAGYNYQYGQGMNMMYY